MPTLRPATVPELLPMVPTVVLTLVHVPPPVPSVSVVPDRSQMLKAPLIAPGCVFTVTTALATQLPMVYDIKEVPTLRPVTVPELLPIVPTVVFTLDHTPPPVPSVSVVLARLQKLITPFIAPGCTFTVSTAVDTQLPMVYDIKVVPTLRPATVPELLPIVPTVVFTLDHTPPPVPSVSVLPERSQMLKAPLIAPGCVFTVTTALATQLPMVYDIKEVPTLRPITVPELLPTVPTVVFTLDHNPPPVPSVSVVLARLQKLITPFIAPGCTFTVSTAVETQLPMV